MSALDVRCPFCYYLLLPRAKTIKSSSALKVDSASTSRTSISAAWNKLRFSSHIRDNYRLMDDIYSYTPKAGGYCANNINTSIPPLHDGKN